MSQRLDLSQAEPVYFTPDSIRSILPEFVWTQVPQEAWQDENFGMSIENHPYFTVPVDQCEPSTSDMEMGGGEDPCKESVANSRGLNKKRVRLEKDQTVFEEEKPSHK